MKKTLLITFLLSLFVSSFAQVNIREDYSGKIEGYLRSIPSFFAKNNKTKLFFASENYSKDSILFTILGDDFTIEQRFEISVVPMDYFDFDASLFSEHMEIYLTQTLFNNDEEYEFFVCNRGDDGYVLSVQLISNNEVLYTFNPPANSAGLPLYPDISLFKYRDNLYVWLAWHVGRRTGDAWYDGGTYSNEFYSVNHGSVTSVLEPVDIELPFNVIPSVASRSQNITIQIGDETDASEVSIIESNGRIVKRFDITPGQREITIPAAELGTGIKVVSATNGNLSATRKIIIR